MPRAPSPPSNCSNRPLWRLVASYASPIDYELLRLYRKPCDGENHPVKIQLQFNTADSNIGRYYIACARPHRLMDMSRVVNYVSAELSPNNVQVLIRVKAALESGTPAPGSVASAARRISTTVSGSSTLQAQALSNAPFSRRDFNSDPDDGFQTADYQAVWFYKDDGAEPIGIWLPLPGYGSEIHFTDYEYKWLDHEIKLSDTVKVLTTSASEDDCEVRGWEPCVLRQLVLPSRVPAIVMAARRVKVFEKKTLRDLMKHAYSGEVPKLTVQNIA